MWRKGDSEVEEGAITGESLGTRSFITERAAALPGAAQKSMKNVESIVGVLEEEVFRRIQTRNLTITTWNTDTA